MKDIPLFTTELGVASLTLSEIPYTGKSYIRIQATEIPAEFLQECIGFCRMAGAKAVYATGHPICEGYPLHTVILQMQGDVVAIGQTDACLFPVTKETVEKFRKLYNDKVKYVPNGAWMTAAAAEKLLQAGNGYFIHREGELIGIGIASGNRIFWVASVVPGGGKAVVQALCHVLTEDTVILEAASANQKAVELYSSLGFVMTGEISRWYQIV